MFFAALNVYIHDLLSEYQFKLSTVYIIARVLLKIQGGFSSDPSGLLPRVYRKLQALMITFFLYLFLEGTVTWHDKTITDSSSSGTLPELGELSWDFLKLMVFWPGFLELARTSCTCAGRLTRTTLLLAIVIDLSWFSRIWWSFHSKIRVLKVSHWKYLIMFRIFQP